MAAPVYQTSLTPMPPTARRLHGLEYLRTGKLAGLTISQEVQL